MKRIRGGGGCHLVAFLGCLFRGLGMVIFAAVL
jgi:hypothetical protein